MIKILILNFFENKDLILSQNFIKENYIDSLNKDMKIKTL